MKFVSHKISAISIGVLMGVQLYGLVVVAAASVFPDVIEFIIPGLTHRGISHALYLYPLLFVLTRSIGLMGEVSGMSFIVQYNLDVYVVLGCCLHILCDMLTKNPVPVLPGWKYSFKVFAAGSIGEIVLVIMLFISAAVYLAEKGGI